MTTTTNTTERCILIECGSTKQCAKCGAKRCSDHAAHVAIGAKLVGSWVCWDLQACYVRTLEAR